MKCLINLKPETLIILCKRLSQCLSPSLQTGVHATTLQTYGIILKYCEHNLINDKPKFAYCASQLHFGLFPFFTIASFETKPIWLNLISEYYIKPHGNYLVHSVKGLTIAILDGVEDPNSDLFNKASKIFNQIENQIGSKYLYESIWNALIKSKKSRLSGLTFLNKNIAEFAFVGGDINLIDK